MARDETHGTPLENPRWERFAQLFVFGHPEHNPLAGKGAPDNPPDTLHNATQAYLAAGFRSRSSGAAAVSGSRLLRNAKILDRIAELQVVRDQVADAFLIRWMTLLPEAQQVLRDAMAGEANTSKQLRAAILVIRLAERERGSCSCRAGPEAPSRKMKVFLGENLLYEA